jgi:hypothetical protein
LAGTAIEVASLGVLFCPNRPKIHNWRLQFISRIQKGYCFAETFTQRVRVWTEMKREKSRTQVVAQVAELAMKFGERYLVGYGAARSRHDFTQRQLMACLILRSSQLTPEGWAF